MVPNYGKHNLKPISIRVHSVMSVHLVPSVPARVYDRKSVQLP